jgi:hypothetical protein
MQGPIEMHMISYFFVFINRRNKTLINPGKYSHFLKDQIQGNL